MTVALAAALVLSLTLSTYLIVAASSWRGAASGWERLAEAHATEAAQATEDLAAARTELAATREQLDTAQARITALADEKAQLGDSNEVQRQLTDYQARVSAAAANVATSLASCVDAQNQLIGYLGERERYDAASLERFAGEVRGFCAEASSANRRLQQELAR